MRVRVNVICISVFSFFSKFSRFGFCTLSAPNRVAATKACENSLYFRVLLVCGIAEEDGDDIDYHAR